MLSQMTSLNAVERQSLLQWTWF